MILHLLIIFQILFINIKSGLIEDCEIGNYCSDGACSTNGNCKIDIFNFTYDSKGNGITSKCECNYGFSSYIKESNVLCCYEKKSHFNAFMLELFLGLGIGHFYIGDVKYGLIKLFLEIFLCFTFCCTTYLACNKEHTIIINLNGINKREEYKIGENIDNEEIKELNENLENDKNSENESKNPDYENDENENELNDLLNKNVMKCPLYKFFIFSSLILFIVLHVGDVLLMGLGIFKDGNGEDLAMWY